MKKILWTVLFSVVLFGCIKNKNPDQVCNYIDSQTIAPDSQVQRVKAYLDLNNITAQKHSSGFYYVIHSPGAGAFVTNLCSTVIVTYKGTLTNGTIFDSTATGYTASFILGQLGVVAWQKGVPLINKGGSITLYIPPALGYGTQVIPDGNGNILIPANSILIFDIGLLDISG